MPSSLGKNLNLCFTKIKFPLTCQSSSSLLISDDNRLPLQSSAATASSLLFKNYNSSLYYDDTFDYSTSKSLTHSSASLSSDHESDSEPDFATVFASQRFFFTSPGSSNSIIESTPSSMATTPESSDTLVASGFRLSPVNTANQSSNDGCDQPSHERSQTKAVKDSVAVPTLSPNPYMDFRRSMQEMVEAGDLIDVKANWDYLHELLLCYLALNPRSTHKFIIGAFADLVVSLMAAQGGGHDGDVTEITGGRIPGQCM